MWSAERIQPLRRGLRGRPGGAASRDRRAASARGAVSSVSGSRGSAVAKLRGPRSTRSLTGATVAPALRRSLLRREQPPVGRLAAGRVLELDAVGSQSGHPAPSRGAPSPLMQVTSSASSASVAGRSAACPRARPRRRAPRRRSRRPRRRGSGRRASSRAAGATAPVRTSLERFAPSRRRWRRRRGAASNAIAAASPACCEREGTTWTCFSDSSAARSAAMNTFGLFGSTTTCSAGTAWMPASRSYVEGLSVAPPSSVCDAEALEQRRGCPRPRRRRARRTRRAARAVARAQALRALLDLLVHVGDVEVRDRPGAVEQRRSRVGVVGVHVDLQRRSSPTTSTESPICSSASMKRARVEAAAGDGEVRAVAVGRGLVLRMRDARGARGARPPAARPRAAPRSRRRRGR